MHTKYIKKNVDAKNMGDIIFVEKRVKRRGKKQHKPSKPVYGLSATFITTYGAFFEYIFYAFGS